MWICGRLFIKEKMGERERDGHHGEHDRCCSWRFSGFPRPIRSRTKYCAARFNALHLYPVQHKSRPAPIPAWCVDQGLPLKSPPPLGVRIVLTCAVESRLLRATRFPVLYHCPVGLSIDLTEQASGKFSVSPSSGDRLPCGGTSEKNK